MAKYYSGITTGTTLDGMLAGGSEFGIFPSQDIDCANINASGIHTVGGFFYPNGGIKDSSDSTGSSGKVLSSTGSGLAWIDPSTGSTANAVNVGTNLNSTDADQFVAFVGTSSGNNPVRVDAGLKYNPSTNILTAPSFSGNLTGTIQTAAQTNITSVGTLTGLTVNGNITQSGTSNYIRINGGLQDKDGQDGDSGQVLSSTGTQVNWINVGDISAGSASQVAVSDESADQTCFPLFVTAATGNQAPKSGSNLTFNSSTGQLNATKFVGDGSGLTNISTLNQSTTGNAATATALETARNIAGTSFDGTASINISYNNLTNKPTIPTNNNQLTNGSGYVTAANAFPSGGIIIWSGAASAIPTGWVLCDGNNSTPDLRDKFVVGASNSTGDTTYPGLSPDATGGAATDTVNISDSASVSFGANGTGTASKAGSSSATVSISDSDTVNTLPPYYALCYIMKS